LDSDRLSNLQAKEIGKDEITTLPKMEKVGEILGLLAETNKGRDWIVKEIKRHHLKIPTETALNSYELLNSCSGNFVTNLHRALQGDTVKGFEDIQSLTKTYHWLLLISREALTRLYLLKTK